MTAKNDVTGDSIKSKVTSDEYRNNYDRIFRRRTDATIMWEHFCKVEGRIMIGVGEDCNWCGAKESGK